MSALRRGYTTGACAQAATAAAAGRPAACAAIPAANATPASGATVTTDAATSAAAVVPPGATLPPREGVVEIDLPGGERATFSYRLDADGTAWVVKDAGDDPDVTHGLAIGARVEETPGLFAVHGGLGVGTVTLPGLPISPGEPAINPVPREAILGELRRRFPAGATATISAPGGEVLAKKTLNPRLGIVGGISILGTTGRVEPWSVEAMRDSLVPQLDVALAQGRTELTFVLGSKGRRLAVDAGTDERDVVETANELGWMLDRAAERGVARVTLRGHVGKLVKLAAGIFDTHSRVADARLVTLAAYAGAGGVPAEEIRIILGMTTADLAAGHLLELGRGDVLAEVASAAAEACRERYGLPVDVVLLDREGVVLATSSRSAGSSRSAASS